MAERHEGFRSGSAVVFPDVRTTLERLLGPEIMSRPDRHALRRPERQLLAGEDLAALGAGEVYVEGFHAADVRRIGVHALAENEGAENEDGEEVSVFPMAMTRVPRWLRAQCAFSSSTSASPRRCAPFGGEPGE